MSFWLISVPHNKSGPHVFDQLQGATAGLSVNHRFEIPPLKVGTLDSLMALSDDLAKQDTAVGGVAKKIEKTYYELWRAEAAEAASAQQAKAAAAGAAAPSSSSQRMDDKAPELRIGDQADSRTPYEYVANWSWNAIRYPTRSALRTLSDLIIRDATKADESLKKQTAEYNEVRTSLSTIERKDAGSLLVRPLGQYVTSPPVETQHLTTLMIVVPRARLDEFQQTYELLEQQAAVREREEAARKAAEAEERARRDQERQDAKDEAAAALAAAQPKSAASAAAAAERQRQQQEEAAKQAEAAAVEASLANDSSAKAKEDEERKQRDEEERKRNKALPAGCYAVVPRSMSKLCDNASEDMVLVSVVVLKQGANRYINLCREKRYTVRTFKYDPAEDKAEKEKKTALANKKKQLWNFLIRWCTTTYTEVFSAWIHLKAIRLYVETVLRYGLPYNAQAMLIEPGRNKERQMREVLKQLYGKLAGNNANLTALDPNEPDLSGLGSDFYPYVYLPLQLGD